MPLRGNVFRCGVEQRLSTGIATLPFVISTEAKRSGETSVLMPLRGNVFCSGVEQRLSTGIATFPFVISTEAKRSGETSVWLDGRRGSTGSLVLLKAAQTKEATLAGVASLAPDLWRFRASEIDAWIDRQIAG
ncbi:MAG: hypothetical protein WCD57_14445 [Acidobacteriaceae bacterium]